MRNCMGCNHQGWFCTCRQLARCECVCVCARAKNSQLDGRSERLSCNLYLSWWICIRAASRTVSNKGSALVMYVQGLRAKKKKQTETGLVEEHAPLGHSVCYLHSEPILILAKPHNSQRPPKSPTAQDAACNNACGKSKAALHLLLQSP